MKLRSTTDDKFARSIASYVNNLPEKVREYTLYQLERDPSGLFIKYYLLSIAAGEPNSQLAEIMRMWNVTEKQLSKYQQELIEEGLLEAQSNLKF